MSLFRRWPFAIFCLLLAFVAYHAGSIRSPNWADVPRAIKHATVTPPHPPTVRLTDAELTLRDQRLAAVFGQAIPKTLPVWRPYNYILKAEKECLAKARKTPHHLEACEIYQPDILARTLLNETHPKVETLFVRTNILELNAAFFFLGKDGKAKLLLYPWNSRKTPQVIATVPGGTTTALDLDLNFEAIYFGDDPGPGATSYLSLRPSAPVPYPYDFKPGNLPLDADLQQRFRYYAALQGKPYDPKDWVPKE